MFRGSRGFYRPEAVLRFGLDAAGEKLEELVGTEVAKERDAMGQMVPD
jgi:hypothetical protein